MFIVDMAAERTELPYMALVAHFKQQLEVNGPPERLNAWDSLVHRVDREFPSETGEDLSRCYYWFSRRFKTSIDGVEPVLFVNGNCSWAKGLLDALNERMAADPEFLDRVWDDDLDMELGQLARYLPSELLGFRHENLDQYLAILSKSGNAAYYLFLAVQEDSCKNFVPEAHRKLLYLFSTPPTNRRAVEHSHNIDPYHVQGQVFDLMAETGLFRIFPSAI